MTIDLELPRGGEPGPPRRRTFHLAEPLPRFYTRFLSVLPKWAHTNSDAWVNVGELCLRVPVRSRSKVMAASTYKVEWRVDAGEPCTYCGRALNGSAGNSGGRTRPCTHCMGPRGG